MVKKLSPNRIIKGDCLRVMAKWPDNSVDMILTDPPWFVSKQIKIHRSLNPQKYKYVGKDISLDFGQWDHFDSEEAYWNYITARFSEMVRVLKPKGHLITFFDQNRIGHLIEYLRKHNMLLRQHLYWLKSNPVPRARKVDFMVALEQAVWFTKGTKSGATFNYQLGQQANYVKHSIVGRATKADGERIHPTQKPIGVMKVWIRYLTNENELIVDPFCGSGTICVAAWECHRNFIGIENKRQYAKAARKRLKQFTGKRLRWSVGKQNKTCSSRKPGYARGLTGHSTR